VTIIGSGYYFWRFYNGEGLPAGIVGGNGRIEATEIDISAKTAGRIKEILVDEGAFVKAGELLAIMDTQQLEAQRKQAEASLRRAVIGVDTAKSLLSQREAEREAAVAVMGQREAVQGCGDRCRLAATARPCVDRFYSVRFCTRPFPELPALAILHREAFRSHWTGILFSKSLAGCRW
jgi:Multidrug resistance efflux pump